MELSRDCTAITCSSRNAEAPLAHPRFEELKQESAQVPAPLLTAMARRLIGFCPLGGGLSHLDLVQEAYAAALDSGFADFDSRYEVPQYLYRKMLDARRTCRQAAKRLPTQSIEHVEDVVAEERSEGDEPSNAPLLRHLAVVLPTLPPRYVEILTLRHWHELSYEEISEQLGICLGTVATQLRRARMMLRNAIEMLKRAQGDD